MNLSVNQTFVSRWGRLALSVFVFGWMNAVAQPCLMDMPAMTETRATAAHGDHGGHVMEHDVAGTECEHCPPGGHNGPDDCLSDILPACGNTGDVIIDGRTAKLESGNLPDEPETLATSVDRPPVRKVRYEYVPDCQPRDLPAGPPLNLRHCVFLK